uniref:Movement protein n=1 Tax=Peach mosaic virus TaxID=183585 RepID=A0A3S7JLW1_9VIRU|nr:movement protein [Peach mosaic virus]QDR50345.1 movement protein [Peach mosaic virus]
MALMMRAHRSKIAEGDIPISGVKSSKIYSDVTPFKRASDLMIHWSEFAFKIMPDDIGEGGFRLMSVPVIPKSEVDAIRRERGSANYAHWGALSISIDALFKKQSGVTGRCVVFDKRWDNCKQAVLQTFEFSLDSGSATMITSPNFSVSLDDPNINDSLCVVVVFNDLNFKKESYPVSVHVGHMCRFFDSFLSSEAFKNESNVYLESSGADLLSYKAFGFGEDEEVERLFSFAEVVPTEAINVNVRELPGTVSNLFRKKRVKQFSYGSASDPRRRKGKRFAGVKFPAIDCEQENKFEKPGRNFESAGAHRLREEIRGKPRNSFCKSEVRENVGKIEPSDEDTDRFDQLSVSSESSFAQPIRAGKEADTEINLCKYSNSRDIGLNGIYFNHSGSKELDGSGSAGVLQSEDDCWVDQTFRVNKRG